MQKKINTPILGGLCVVAVVVWAVVVYANVMHRIVILAPPAGGAAAIGNFCVVEDTLDTGTPTYTQDITCADSFGTPAAAIILITNAVSDFDTAVADGLAVSIGFTDGSTDVHLAGFSEDAAASSNASNESSAISGALTATNSTTLDFAATASMITDGVRLSITNSPASNYQVRVVLFKGGSWYVGQFNGNGSIDGVVDVTDPGFEPDIVFMTYGRVPNCSGTYINTTLPFGFAINPDTQTFQGAQQNYIRTSVPTMRTSGMSSITYATGAHTDTGIQVQFLIDTFDASGFSATTKESTSGSTRCVAYLAGSFTNGWGGNIDTPTATGTETITSPGFRPTFVMFISGLNESSDSIDSTSAGTTSISFADCYDDGTVQRQTTTTWSDEDAAADSNTKVFVDDVMIHTTADDGTELLKATLSSCSASGATLSWSAVDGTAKKRIALFMN